MNHINKENIQELLNAYYDDEVVRFNTDCARQLEEKGYSELPEKTTEAIKVIIELNKQDDILYNWLVLKKELTIQ